MRKFAVAVISLFFLTLSGLVSAEAPVDINTADAVTLAKAMKGVGEKRAEAIVSYRKEHGPFKSVDDLAKIKGISKKMVEENRKNLTSGKL